MTSSNEEILKNSDVPWINLVHAKVIDADQLEMILGMQEKATEPRKLVALFHEKALKFVALFTDILTGASQEAFVKYSLALLDVITGAEPNIALYFPKFFVETKGAWDPIKTLLKWKTSSTPDIQEKASSVLGKVLGAPPPPGAPEEMVATLDAHLSDFADWAVSQLKGVSPTEAAAMSAAAAMSTVQALVGTMRGREAALAAEIFIPLSSLLMASSMSNSSSTVQLLYQTLFSMWSLSYSPDGAIEMATSKVGLVAKLVEIVKASPKEKVVRVALSTLRNLLGVGSASNDMVVFGLMPVLEGMLVRKFADEDIPEDVEHLHQSLQVNLLGLTSWDVYKAELDSGKLEWSPSHKSENFWKDNYKRFEENESAALKKLVVMLSADDPQVLAIACNDIAEFIKFHPEGRRLMTTAGAKPLAMQVLKHPDPSVQKYALVCVQRLMVINWEYLNR